MKIILAETDIHVRAVRQLFEEYAASLSFCLCFQDFGAELLGLPGDYGPPGGRLLLATAEDGAAAGCVALRALQPRIGEMKRLFVRPAYRGTGLGKELTRTVLRDAVSLDYDRVRLDTTPAMAEALRLYEALGFRRVEAYRHNPVEGAVYMEIALTPAHEG